MSCPAEDGRHVSGALRVRHSTAATAAMPMVMMVVAHVVARSVLGAGRYCLDAVVVDATAADVAAAAAGAATAAAAANPVIVDDVAGRVQRRLAGVVQPVKGILLLGGRLFEIFDAVLDVALPLGGRFNLRQDRVRRHRLRSLAELLHEAKLLLTVTWAIDGAVAVFLRLGRNVRGRGARLEPLVPGGLLWGHAPFGVPLKTPGDKVNEDGIVAPECLGQRFGGRFSLAALGIGDAPWSASGIEKQPPPGGSIDEIIRWNAQNFHNTR